MSRGHWECLEQLSPHRRRRRRRRHWRERGGEKNKQCGGYSIFRRPFFSLPFGGNIDSHDTRKILSVVTKNRVTRRS